MSAKSWWAATNRHLTCFSFPCSDGQFDHHTSPVAQQHLFICTWVVDVRSAPRLHMNSNSAQSRPFDKNQSRWALYALYCSFEWSRSTPRHFRWGCRLANCITLSGNGEWHESQIPLFCWMLFCRFCHSYKVTLQGFAPMLESPVLFHKGASPTSSNSQDIPWNRIHPEVLNSLLLLARRVMRAVARVLLLLCAGRTC